MRKKKVVIIGAGPGGLAAAMLLTAQGYGVEVYEKRSEVGGRNSGFKLGEYTFDLGPTFFLMKDVLEDIFSKTGRKLQDCVKLAELETMYRLRFRGGRELLLSRDPEKMKAALEAFSPGSWDGYQRYLKAEKVKYDKLIPCLALPYESVLDLFKLRFLGALPWLDAHLSLSDVLARYFRDPMARLAFTFQAKYIGMSPWEAPGTFSIISYIEHGGGIFHVQGGLNRLSAAMADAVKADGGKVFTSAPVKRLIVEDRTARGVELADGTRVEADHVVVNADFARAMTSLVDPAQRRKYTDADLAARRYSCSTFMLYLGLKKTWPKHPHHNIIFADDYKANLEDIGRFGRVSADQSFYVQNACVTDPSLAPAGKSAIYVLAPVANNSFGIDWKKEAGPFRERLLELLEKRGGFDGLRGAIEYERVVTPDDWQADMDVYNGAVFNLSHHMGQMLFLRPHNRFEEFRNCWLVGGGTHPGSGLPTIYESARISAELLARQDREGR